MKQWVYLRAARTPINTVLRNTAMRAFEFTNLAQQQVDGLKQATKAAQKRAKQAALRAKLQKTQQQLAQANQTT